MGVPDVSRRALAAARKVAGSAVAYFDICAEAMYGDPDKSVKLLNSAVKSGKLGRIEANRDPNLHFLFEENSLDDGR